ncbi:hypothetical protein ACFQ0G_29305 [Streptomyces chiangmaiensis]
MSTRGREPLSLEKGLAEPEDAVPVAWDASRPRLRERFTRRQLAMRAAWAVGGLLIVYAAVAFLAKGMWVEASVLWVGPIFWVIAWETALSTVEFWSVKKPHRARLVPARYVRTERRAQRFVQAYRLRTDDSEEVLWRRDSGDSLTWPRCRPGVSGWCRARRRQMPSPPQGSCSCCSSASSCSASASPLRSWE